MQTLRSILTALQGVGSVTTADASSAGAQVTAGLPRDLSPKPTPALYSQVMVAAYIGIGLLFAGAHFLIVIAVETALLVGVWYWNSARLDCKIREEAHKRMRERFLMLGSLNAPEKRRLAKPALVYYLRSVRAERRNSAFTLLCLIAIYGLGFWSLHSEIEWVALAGAFTLGFGLYFLLALLAWALAPMDADSKAFTQLVDVLLMAERLRPGVHSVTRRKALIPRLDSASRSVRHYLSTQTGRLPRRDMITKRILRNDADAVARRVRELKILIAFPGPDSRELLVRELKNDVLAIAEGNWASLPRAGAALATSRWGRRALVSAQVLLVGAALAGIAFAALSDELRDKETRVAIIGGLSGIALFFIQRLYARGQVGLTSAESQA